MARRLLAADPATFPVAGALLSHPVLMMCGASHNKDLLLSNNGLTTFFPCLLMPLLVPSSCLTKKVASQHGGG